MSQSGLLTLKIVVDDKGRPIVKGMNAEIKKLGNTTETATKKGKVGFGGMWKSMAVGMGVMTGISGAMRLLKSSIGGAVSSATNFETEFANVTTLLGDNANIQQMQKDILNMAGQLGSAQELTQGLYQALSAGVEPAKAVRFVGESARFAKAALTDTKTAVDVLTTVIEVYGGTAEDVTGYSDILFETIKRGKTTGDELASSFGRVLGVAKNTGISFIDLNAAVATMTGGGIKTTEVMSSLKAVISNIATPTGEAAKVAEKLHINFNLAGLKAKGFGGFLKDLTEKVKGDVQAQKNLFGSIEAFNAIAVLTSETGLKKFKEAQEANLVATGNTTEAFEKQAKTFSSVWQGIKNEAEAVLIKILLPALNDLATWAKDNKDAIVNVFKGIVKGIELVMKVSGGFIKFLSLVKDFVKSDTRFQIKPLDMSYINVKELKPNLDRAKGYIYGFQTTVNENLSTLSKTAKREFGYFNNEYSRILENKDPKIRLRELRQLIEKAETGKFTKGLKAIALQIKANLKPTKKLVKAGKDLSIVTTVETEKIKDEADANRKNLKVVEKVIKSRKVEIALIPDQINYTKENINVMEEYEGTIEGVTDATDDDIESMKIHIPLLQKISDKFETTGGKIKKFADKLYGLADGASQLAEAGIISEKFAGTIENIASGAQGIGEVSTGLGKMVSGDIIGGLSDLAGGIAKVWSSLKGLFGSDGVGMAIKAQNNWMDLTEDQTEALRELEKELGGVHVATSTYLDTLIEQNMTFENSEKMLHRIREIWSDVHQGTLSADDAVKEINDSFSAFIKKAKELGTTGSKEFFNLVNDMKNNGVEIISLNDFILDSIKSGFEGYKQYLKGDFSDATIGVFEDMIQWENKVAKNQSLIDGIKGLETALFGMSDAMILNDEQFDSFEQGTRDAYDALRKAGFSGNEALMQIAPTLKRLKFLQEEFNLELDDSTKKLISEADANGLLSGDPIDRMADAMEKFIALLSEQLGLTTKNSQAIEQQQRIYDSWNPKIHNFDDGSGRGKGGNEFNAVPKFATGADFIVPRGFDNDTFPMRVSSGEGVKVTPANEMGSGSGGGEINNHFNIKSNTGDDTIRQIIEGMRTNRFGINNELRKVV